MATDTPDALNYRSRKATLEILAGASTREYEAVVIAPKQRIVCLNMIINNQQELRFELEEQGKLVIADYTLADGVITLPHVEADTALRGTGAAGRLMAGIAVYARENGYLIRPICSYAVAYLRKHSEYHDLVNE